MLVVTVDARRSQRRGQRARPRHCRSELRAARESRHGNSQPNTLHSRHPITHRPRAGKKECVRSRDIRGSVPRFSPKAVSGSEIDAALPAGQLANSEVARPARRLLRPRAALLHVGTHGAPPGRARGIMLTNLIALIATVSTLPYQLFYLSDLSRYAWVFAANMVF